MATHHLFVRRDNMRNECTQIDYCSSFFPPLRSAQFETLLIQREQRTKKKTVTTTTRSEPLYTHTPVMKRTWIRRLSSAIKPPNRGISAGTKWISTFRYGFEGSPVFGCFPESSASSTTANNSNADGLQRYLYCKALVYASCGGRLARDWIAGCASLSVSDAELVAIALHHDASKDDLVRFQKMLEKRRLLGTSALTADEGEGYSGGSDAAAATASCGELGEKSPLCAGKVTSPIPEFFPLGFRTPSLAALSPGTSHPDEDDETAPEQYLRPLSNGEAETILRCFVYDCVKAASFHTSSLLAEQILHLEHVCAVLGLAGDGENRPSSPPSPAAGASSTPIATPITFLQTTIDIVNEEKSIMQQKFRVIGQQGSRH